MEDNGPNPGAINMNPNGRAEVCVRKRKKEKERSKYEKRQKRERCRIGQDSRRIAKLSNACVWVTGVP